jgi:hypothetical protein
VSLWPCVRLIARRIDLKNAQRIKHIRKNGFSITEQTSLFFFPLKRVKREQTEEEAGNHRGLSATELPEEGSGSYFFALAVRDILAPVALGLGLGMERSSLLLVFLDVCVGKPTDFKSPPM